jgi:hypothetical protein
MLGGNSHRKGEAQSFFGDVDKKSRDESNVIKLGY